VGHVLAETQKLASARLGAALAPDEWLRIVGPKIAARTRVGRLQRGTLVVYAASSAWCNELSFLASDIVTRLREAGWDVDELHVRIGSFEALPSAPGPAAVERVPLPPELEARLALIDDPALRQAVAEAAALSLARSARTTPPSTGPTQTKPPPPGERGGRSRR
jgi:hypothetical protein